MTNKLNEKHNEQLWVKKGSQSGIMIDPSDVDVCLYQRERDEMVVSGIKELPSADELNRVILPQIQQYSKTNGKPFDIFEARSMHYLISVFKDLGCRVVFSAPISHIKGDAIVYSNNRACFLEAKEKTPIHMTSYIDGSQMIYMDSLEYNIFNIDVTGER